MMRKIFVMLLAVVLLVSFMTVPALADGIGGAVGTGGGGANGGGNTGNDNSGGSDPITSGEQKGLDDDGQNTPVEEQDPPVEEQNPPVEEQVPPVEEQDLPVEEQDPPVVEQDPPVEELDPPVEEQDPPAVDPVKENKTDLDIRDLAQQKTEEPQNDPTEMFLLVALIAGIGAICALLLIRRFLDI